MPGKYANNFCSKNIVMRFEHRINQTSNVLQRFYKTYQPSNCAKCDYETICILVLLRDISNPLGYIRQKKLVFTLYVNEECGSSTSQKHWLHKSGQEGQGINHLSKSRFGTKRWPVQLYNMIFCCNISAAMLL